MHRSLRGLEQVSDPVTVAKVILAAKTDTETKYLILRSSEWEDQPDRSLKPDLPGGEVEKGESIYQAASRELKEETGLDANLKIIGNMRQIRKDAEGNVIEDGVFYICYTDEIEEKEIKTNKEGEYFWISLDEVENLEKIFKPSLLIGVNEIKDRLNGKTSWENKFIYELEPEPEEY